MRMDYRLLFAVIFLNIVSSVLSASTTSSYENITSITTESSTILPISNETSTLPANDNGTTATPEHNSSIPMTIEPSSNNTGSTVITVETTSSKPISIHTTVPLPKTTSAASSGFDGGSFAGGIALGAVLVLIMFGVFCFCRRRTGSGNLIHSVEY